MKRASIPPTVVMPDHRRSPSGTFLQRLPEAAEWAALTVTSPTSGRLAVTLIRPDWSARDTSVFG